MCRRDLEAEAGVFSRSVGDYRPVSRWNKGKKAEYADRVMCQGECEGDSGHM